MIVSILQLMGFPTGKPVHSRAKETANDQAQASATRRHEVKAKSGTKSKAPAVAAKAKAVAKPAAKPVAKAASKVAAKPVAKPAAKVAPKPVAKKAAAKPAAKPVSKPAAKVVKPVAKPVAKAAAKPAAKAAGKAPAKPVAKPAAKKTVKPTPSQAAVKPVSKSVQKPSAVVVAAAKSAPKVAPAEPATASASSKEKIGLSASPIPAKAAAPVAAAPAPVPAKAGRPSSRLASLTVPSMAQSVASTAAKASYSQSEPLSPVIVPALASAVKKDPKLANNWKTKPATELTDAELMAMPDSEYMNDVQMAAFRAKLVNLKRDILNSAGETTEHLREDTSVVPDPADRATIEEEHALELRTRDRERKLLKKIEQSIGRIDAGDYGYCDETGEPIGVGRLLARPTATLSLEAQQRRELKQKMFGD